LNRKDDTSKPIERLRRKARGPSSNEDGSQLPKEVMI